MFWLISNIRLYLTGFLKSRNRPETSKKNAKIRANRTSAPRVYHPLIKYDGRLREIYASLKVTELGAVHAIPGTMPASCFARSSIPAARREMFPWTPPHAGTNWTAAALKLFAGAAVIRIIPALASVWIAGIAGLWLRPHSSAVRPSFGACASAILLRRFQRSGRS